MHAHSVGESMSDTCGYKNPRLQSQKLAYCKCVCTYVRVCMCQCVSVGKTLSGVYVRVIMCVQRVFGRVLGRASFMLDTGETQDIVSFVGQGH